MEEQIAKNIILAWLKHCCQIVYEEKVEKEKIDKILRWPFTKECKEITDFLEIDRSVLIRFSLHCFSIFKKSYK